jgi:hypothetical protein
MIVVIGRGTVPNGQMAGMAKRGKSNNPDDKLWERDSDILKSTGAIYAIVAAMAGAYLRLGNPSDGLKVVVVCVGAGTVISFLLSIAALAVFSPTSSTSSSEFLKQLGRRRRWIHASLVATVVCLGGGAIAALLVGDVVSAAVLV